MVKLDLNGEEDLELLRLYLMSKKIPLGQRLLIELEEAEKSSDFKGEAIYRMKLSHRPSEAGPGFPR